MEDWSVSKGVFAYSTYKVGQKRKRNEKTDHYAYKKEPSFLAFKETWSTIENAAKNANMKAFRQILLDLENFVKKVKSLPLLRDEIPTGILLAGVNLPDHDILIDKVVSKLQSITPYIATIWSRDCPTLKHLTEKLVYQIINGNVDEEEEDTVVVKRNQCTFYALQAWHNDKVNQETPIIIIVPDFESFNPKILHDFILILGSYTKTIKFVLIFGVATTLHIVHRSLTYDATSKLKIQVFRTQSQTEYLSDILDGLICSSNIPFKVIDKAFCLLVDLFLYYDFSVNGFLQSYKICMWRHFFEHNEFKLCCRREDIIKKVDELNNEDIKRLKKLPSLIEYMKERNIVKKEDFKKLMILLSENFHDYINSFLIILKCLHIFTVDMPNRPFGKMFREIYTEAVKKTSIVETSEYKEAMKLMRMWSKGELLGHVKKVIIELENSKPILSDVIEKLEEHYELLDKADLKIIEECKEEKPSTPIIGRSTWMKDLKNKSKIHNQSPYTKALSDFVEYLDTEVFRVYLKSPSQVPLNEIFCFDDAKTIKSYVRGSMKGSIHTALTAPEETYTFERPPDISVAFKLHLENRKMINMYDWLQSFRTIVDPKENEEDENEKDVDPVLQARFTQSVAELQFLGFIKATQRKTDHVKRLNV